MDIFSGTISNLENALGRANVKQKVISNNIANIDTPNYKSKNVAFHDMLNDASIKLDAKKHTKVTLIFQKQGLIIQLFQATVLHIKKTEIMSILIKR